VRIVPEGVTKWAMRVILRCWRDRARWELRDHHMARRAESANPWPVNDDQHEDEPIDMAAGCAVPPGFTEKLTSGRCTGQRPVSSRFRQHRSPRVLLDW
jgi:hypothetical protein